MRRRDVLIGGGSIAVATLAGCTSRASPAGSSDTQSDTRTISVSGSGSVVGEPDLARFRAGLQETGSDAGTVRNELVDREEELVGALQDAGIDEDRITTGRFDVREIRRRPESRDDAVADDSAGGESQEEIYYEGTHSLDVEVEDIERVGDILDTAIDGGADEIGRLTFTLSEENREVLREEALSNALDDAEAEAEHIAAEIDAQVVEIERVTTAGGGVSNVRRDGAVYDEADDVATEVHPDDIDVSATVDVVVEIR